MIPLHRLTHPSLPLYLNPDLIQTIEATPDTVVALTNATRFVVNETPVEVLTMIRDWRAGILAKALERSDGPVPEGLAQVVHLSRSTDPAAHDF
ncbi:MAG: flagellar protein FlbD [Gaiellales bacterium]|jgi:flagellar protein FlbD|nr:flagellar protein FlbD [Gaiellales bacterium]